MIDIGPGYVPAFIIAVTVGLTITFSAGGADHVRMIVPPTGDPYRLHGRVRIEGAFIFPAHQRQPLGQPITS